MPVAPPTSEPPGARRDAPLALVLVGALLIRLWHLGARSVWTDEGSAWTAASAPLRELIRLCAEKDASPPLFHLLTALALKLGGDEAHLRAVSVLASLGLVWITYRLMRLFSERSEATLAAAITALSPYQLMYAQEARTYALVAFLSLASCYLFLRAVVLDRPRAWWPYVAVTTLALYTQSIALLSLGLQGALAVLTSTGRRHAIWWTLAVLISVMLYLPWLLVTLGQVSRLSSSHWYVGPPGEHGVFQVLRAVLVSPVPLVTAAKGSALPGLSALLSRPGARGAIATILALPLVLAILTLRRRDAFFPRLMLAALVLPLLAVLAVSARHPLFLPRYFVFLTPFVAILLTRGLSILRPRALRTVWSALVLAVGAYGCVRYDLDYTKERWRDVVSAIARTADPARAAVLVTFDIDPFRYYNVRLARPLPAFEVSHPEVPFASDYDARQLAEVDSAATTRTAPFDEVWVVVRSPNSEIRREVALRAERDAATGRRFAGRWRWDATGGPLRVARYVRMPETGSGKP